ncbi:MAG: ATP-binding protein, partial [Flavobacteriia bacterium]|nr:ATP-binding protein [Flavobacteriia bacterium]
MLVKTYSSTVFGINATTITIEVNLEIGINFYLVGLPDNAVKESHQQRIKAAFKNNNLKFPGREITVNMAPADIRKEGSVFDLPIAIGILAVSKQVKLELLSNYILIGELSLDGSIQATRGVLAIALQAKQEGFKGIIVPKANALEAAVVNDLEVYGAKNLAEVIRFLNQEEGGMQQIIVDVEKQFGQLIEDFELDFRDV